MKDVGVGVSIFLEQDGFIIVLEVEIQVQCGQVFFAVEVGKIFGYLKVQVKGRYLVDYVFFSMKLVGGLVRREKWGVLLVIFGKFRNYIFDVID